MTEQRRTALFELHRHLGAKMVPFGGWEMPLRYEGTVAEHHAVRGSCGLFDVSHLGVIDVRGDLPGVCAGWLETLLPAAVSALTDGQMAYSAFTLPTGGVLDDVVVTRLGDRFRVVVNAERTSSDLAYLTHAAQGAVGVELRRDLATLALAGPAAEDVLAEVVFGGDAPQATAVRELVFMSALTCEWNGGEMVVARAGYTGEDGFEISVSNDAADALARALLADGRVTPAGLGARDTLRLEAGLCLMGADIDETTTLTEAGLGWVVPKARRHRAAGFPGADVIAAQLANGAPRRRVGIAASGRRPIRAGAELRLPVGSGGAAGSNGSSGGAASPVGRVTSGGYSPTLGRPVAMGYVRAELAGTDTELVAITDGREDACRVAALPFVPHRYRRSAQR